MNAPDPELTVEQYTNLAPLLQNKWQEYCWKGGNPKDVTEFWRWLTGADHRCPPLLGSSDNPRHFWY